MSLRLSPEPVFRSVLSRLIHLQRTRFRPVCGISPRRILSCVKTRAFTLSSYIILSMALIVFMACSVKTVQVIDGKGSKFLYTLRNNPVAILSQEGITLSSEDRYQTTRVSANYLKIDLFQAFPVKISFDKQSKTVMIAKGSVSDALAKAAVSVGSDDLVNHPLTDPVSDGMQIVVNRVTYKTVTQSTPVSYQVVTHPTTLLCKGSQQVQVPGREGQVDIQVRQKYIDGVLANQEELSRSVVSNPVNCELIVGTAASTPVSKLEPPSSFALNGSGLPSQYARIIKGVATGYSPADGTGTATGRRAKVGYVAVNPKKIPYGSRLYIMSDDGSFVYGYAIAADTGGFASNGSGVDVDLFFPSGSDSSRFGRRSVEIFVLK